MFNMCSAPGVLSSWGLFINVFTMFFPLFFGLFYALIFGAMVEEAEKRGVEEEKKLFKTFFITLGGLVLFGFVGVITITGNGC